MMRGGHLDVCVLACVSRVYTEFGTFAVGSDGVRVINTYGISVCHLRERIGVQLRRIEA
jgi:3-oxoadipate CoA-transferase beta subunit